MARTGQWQGEGAGNLNPAWSGRLQWRCARRLGAARRREDGCGVSGLCADPAAEVAGYGGGKEGKGSLWQLSSRVWGSGGAGRTSGCQKGLGSAGGRAGRQSLGGVGGGVSGAFRASTVTGHCMEWGVPEQAVCCGRVVAEMKPVLMQWVTSELTKVQGPASLAA